MGSPFFVGIGSVNISAGDQTVGNSASQAINDAEVLVVKSANQPITLLTASGFSEVGVQQGTGTPGAASSSRLAWYRRVCEVAGEASPVVAAQADGSQQVSAILTFRGAYIGNPPKEGSRGIGTGTAVSAAGGVTTTLNTLVVLLLADGHDASGPRLTAQANGSLVAVTERLDNGTNAGVGGGVSGTSGSKAAIGAYGLFTATLAGAAGWEYATVILSSLAEPVAPVDTTPPVIENISPTAGPSVRINRRQPVTFEIFDAVGFRRILPAVRYPGLGAEHTIHDGVAFLPEFEKFSTRTELVVGKRYRYTVIPTQGQNGLWPDSPQFYARAFDVDGNETA